MFDLDGNVIGINSQILAPTGGNVGIGFAIPAETAVPIIETLKKGRPIKRGYLGVGIGPMSDDLAESLGLPKNRGERSEEHTSELQSLMRNSYAVFCLKKQTKNT